METATPYADRLKYYRQYADWLRFLHKKRELCKGKNNRAALEELDGRIRMTRWQIERRTAAALKQGIELPLETLCEKFGLDDFEKMLVAALLAVYLEPSFRKLMGNNVDLRMRDILELLCDSAEERIEARRRFQGKSPLIESGLVLLRDWNPECFLESAFLDGKFFMSRDMVSYLLGERSVPCQLPLEAALVEPAGSLDDIFLPAGKIEEARRIFSGHESYLKCRMKWGFGDAPNGNACLALFSGTPGTGKAALAEALAKEFGWKMLRVSVPKMIKRYWGDANFLRMIRTTAVLTGAMVFLDGMDEVIWSGELTEKISRLDCPIIMTASDPEIIESMLGDKLLWHLRFGTPGSTLRRRLWRKLLPEAAGIAEDVDLDALADEFELNGGEIRDVISAAAHGVLSRGEAERGIRREDLAGEAKAALAKRKSNARTSFKTPAIHLDEVVLPRGTREELCQFVYAVRHRKTVYEEWGFSNKLGGGKGVNALFSGPSGVGKTMAAEAVAHELGQGLLVVNPSEVTSKWYGETTVNLASLFKTAKEENLILFFDEADSYFTARVQDAGTASGHLRNQEINYLLTAVENHEGVVILATNHPDILDVAFERRLHYRIQFPEPDQRRREAIWRGLIPGRARIDGEIDFPRLAREFPITGGKIRNAVMRAAFLAASRGCGITTRILRETARGEKAHEPPRIGFAAHDSMELLRAE